MILNQYDLSVDRRRGKIHSELLSSVMFIERYKDLVSDEGKIIAASKAEAVFYTNLLRSKELLADILSTTTGMNRGRIKWDTIRELAVPKYDEEDQMVIALVAELESFWEAYRQFSDNKKLHEQELVRKFNVDGADAHERWLGFKPPE